MAADPHLAARHVIRDTPLGPLPAPAPRFGPDCGLPRAQEAQPSCTGKPADRSPWELSPEAWQALTQWSRDK